MLANEKISIAAHLHVLLRRKTGRVTDTEWMATNREYALEIIRFARQNALEHGHAELGILASRLADALAISATPPVSASASVRQSRSAPESGFGESVSGKDFADSQSAQERKLRDAPRYVAGLR